MIGKGNSMKIFIKLFKMYVSCWLLVGSWTTNGFFVSGEGHYSARAQWRTDPRMSPEGRSHQALEQSFRLFADTRFNEKSSIFLELRLFDDPRNAYLGDTVAEDAAPFTDTNSTSYYQNPYHPRYKSFVPSVTQAYARYAFDYCILEAGRRSRDWGLGILHNSGKNPFSSNYSLYDGVSCRVNIQKSQNIGFYASYDKLAESLYKKEGTTTSVANGVNSKASDMYQYTFTVELDDAKQQGSNHNFHKQIGFYYAHIDSGDVSKGGSGTDLNFIDIYFNFMLPKISLISKSEFLFLFGENAAGSAEFGGKEDSDKIVVNKVTSVVAFATNLEWSFWRSGSYIGPKEYKQGDFARHVIFADIALAPGDGQGYYSSSVASSGIRKSDRPNTKAKAFKFNPNYKLALIMFNGRSQIDGFKVDGVFDPNSLMNTRVFSLGYRYESLSIGNIEGRVTHGRLIANVPTAVSTYYTSNPAVERPIGFYSKNLGVEVDVSYTLPFGKAFEFGVSGGYLFAGDAWKTKEGGSSKNNTLLQSQITYHF